MNSRQKGKRGELELAAFLREHGYDCHRGRQFNGRDGSPDVVGVPGIHVECKRCEAGNPYDWLRQALRDADIGTTPVVMHRRSQREWIAILRLEDLLKIIQRSAASTASKPARPTTSSSASSLRS